MPRISFQFFNALVLALLCSTLALEQAAHAAEKNDGSDLAFGGAGSEPGQFIELRHMVFDSKDNLHVLDGGELKRGERKGNFRIQTFDSGGKFISQFPIWDEKLGDKNQPLRLAVDSAGKYYISQPLAGVVQQYSADGKFLRNIDVPGASALTVWRYQNKEWIVAVGNPPKKKAGSDGSIVCLIDPLKSDQPPAKLELTPGIAQCINATTDREGNLYFLAAVNQIFKYGPDGKRLETIGAGENTRAEDGSVLLHSVAVDGKGNIYSMTHGNPGCVARFDAALKTVALHHGQFKWADPWSTHSAYVPLAIDSSDRLWVAATGVNDPKGVNFAKYHAKPAILRTVKDLFEPTFHGSQSHSTLLLGFNPVLETGLPYSIAYTLQPINWTFVVKAAQRQLNKINVNYHIYDVYKNTVGDGRFEVSLENGVEARHPIAFTPPKFGWYTMECDVDHDGERLSAIGAHLGVTPKFDGLPELAEGQSDGGWADAARQVFSGLSTMRLHATKDLNKLEKDLLNAEKYGAFVFVQFSDKKDCTPEFVREAVTRFKGRVKYWEIMNEPNFSMKPDEYVTLVKTLYPLIKEIDSGAKVLGPDVCGVNLAWYEAFYKGGAGKFCDILSIHDYEGHESIDPIHWEWKLGALRKLMAENGDAQKELWQTERAITGVRGTFLGGAQAVRVTLHRDLLERLGIPPEHNLHYYLNEAGYSSVPSYLWSRSGPHPGALALRTRAALTLGKKYSGNLDFGPTGNKMFWGLKYANDGGEQTIILRNLGTVELPLELNFSGGDSAEVSDSFGNLSKLSVTDGKITLKVGTLPLYLRLKKGQEVAARPIDFGVNVASQAEITYSTAINKGELSSLNNGIMETIHAGHPHGGTNGAAIFSGNLATLPQTLLLTFPKPHTFGAMLIFGLRADNGFCALLDYDVEYLASADDVVPEDWKTLEKVRTPCPPSDFVTTSGSTVNTWYMDENFFVHRFTPTTTRKLRIVVRRTTYGFVPDAVVRPGSKGIAPQLHLREIEVYDAVKAAP